jgi:hypothetical protein
MTIQDFEPDYSSELHIHYPTMVKFNTAEDYVHQCCIESAEVPLLDFAAAFGFKAARDLSEFYTKGYHKAIEVKSGEAQLTSFTVNEPTLITSKLIYTKESRLGVLNTLMFTVKKDEEVCQLWHDALGYAKLIRKVMRKEISVEVFIDTVKFMNPRFEVDKHIQADPDRRLNLIIKGDRFSSILRGSNSLWEYLTDTDFELDDNVLTPSEKEIEEINNQISSIRNELRYLE